MPRYSLRTLMILTAVGPPIIAFVFLARWLVLSFGLIAAALALWVIVSLSLAHFFARLIASVMD